MTVIITGSRNLRISHTDCVEILALDSRMDQIGEFDLVHGGAPGVDTSFDRFARSNKGEPWGVKSVKVFEADWTAFGPAAGPRRNERMALYGSRIVAGGGQVLCIAVPDRKSVGTWDMVGKASRHGLPVYISNYGMKR